MGNLSLLQEVIHLFAQKYLNITAGLSCGFELRSMDTISRRALEMGDLMLEKLYVLCVMSYFPKSVLAEVIFKHFITEDKCDRKKNRIKITSSDFFFF